MNPNDLQIVYRAHDTGLNNQYVFISADNLKKYIGLSDIKVTFVRQNINAEYEQFAVAILVHAFYAALLRNLYGNNEDKIKP